MVKKKVVKEEKKEGVKEKKNYFSKLKESFKAARFDRRYWNIFFISLIYFVISTLVILFIARDGIESLKQNFDLTALDTFFSASSAESISQEILTSTVPILSMILGIFLLAGIINFFISTGFNGWIWRKIQGKKMNLKFYWKYFALRVVLGVGIFLLIGIGVFTGPGAILFVLASLLIYHLFFAGTIFFAKNNELFSGLKLGFKKGIKIHLFLLPYLFFLILMAVQYFLIMIISQFMVGSMDINSIAELASNFSVFLASFLPFIVISGILGAFFSSYIKIFYAEFVNRV